MTILHLPQRATPATPAVQNSTITPLLCTIRETARLLACDRSTVYRKIDRGELATVGTGRGLRVVRSSIDAWIAANTNERQ